MQTTDRSRRTFVRQSLTEELEIIFLVFLALVVLAVIKHPLRAQASVPLDTQKPISQWVAFAENGSLHRVRPRRAENSTFMVPSALPPNTCPSFISQKSHFKIHSVIYTICLLGDIENKCRAQAVSNAVWVGRGRVWFTADPSVRESGAERQNTCRLLQHIRQLDSYLLDDIRVSQEEAASSCPKYPRRLAPGVISPLSIIHDVTGGRRACAAAN